MRNARTEPQEDGTGTNYVSAPPDLVVATPMTDTHCSPRPVHHWHDDGPRGSLVPEVQCIPRALGMQFVAVVLVSGQGWGSGWGRQATGGRRQ
mmetsp:Transcript_4418/g.7095  ORF Transcript_4418/g.7095 Transcript_4418/m.7095 type:complete len:93 (-) Transcript_4418:730-1008(-)